MHIVEVESVSIYTADIRRNSHTARNAAPCVEALNVSPYQYVFYQLEKVFWVVTLTFETRVYLINV